MGGGAPGRSPSRRAGWRWRRRDPRGTAQPPAAPAAPPPPGRRRGCRGGAPRPPPPPGAAARTAAPPPAGTPPAGRRRPRNRQTGVEEPSEGCQRPRNCQTGVSGRGTVRRIAHCHPLRLLRAGSVPTLPSQARWHSILLTWEDSTTSKHPSHLGKPAMASCLLDLRDLLTRRRRLSALGSAVTLTAACVQTGLTDRSSAGGQPRSADRRSVSACWGHTALRLVNDMRC